MDTQTYTATYKVGEYMSGWHVDYALVNAGIARYMDGWGAVIGADVAAALNAATPSTPTEGDVITFTRADVERVQVLVREVEARREARRAAGPMIKCNCGHSVTRNLVMNTSRGISCPDCYDRMSD